jgi:hypothetical protein
MATSFGQLFDSPTSTTRNSGASGSRGMGGSASVPRHEPIGGSMSGWPTACCPDTLVNMRRRCEMGPRIPATGRVRSSDRFTAAPTAWSSERPRTRVRPPGHPTD